MALVKCHECGGNVSTEAEACPHCGAKPRAVVQSAATSNTPYRAKKTPTTTKVFMILIVAAIAVFYINDLLNSEPGKPGSASATCAKDDLQCLGDKAVIAAGVYCKKPIEQLAKHSVRWTDGTFGYPIFVIETGS